ncbi:hypothetical protein [Micromonospora radicis]|uniref:Uncharacterized protein n=1 Tax=Micromonospora radicis TaxID=1894971 RepID=A0A418MYV9_9ACTN|nr:hypothetical protein [Micromonospora radicis]RIV39946.1 hypothetical protein D2L64_06285 [Micromonospora radicis]
MFEIMNAAQAGRRAELDNSVGRGDFAEAAARRGREPAEHYGLEVERIEFDNAIAHRRLVADLPGRRTGTHVDLFRNTVVHDRGDRQRHHTSAGLGGAARRGGGGVG